MVWLILKTNNGRYGDNNNGLETGRTRWESCTKVGITEAEKYSRGKRRMEEDNEKNKST